MGRELFFASFTHKSVLAGVDTPVLHPLLADGGREVAAASHLTTILIYFCAMPHAASTHPASPSPAVRRHVCFVRCSRNRPNIHNYPKHPPIQAANFSVSVGSFRVHSPPSECTVRVSYGYDPLNIPPRPFVGSDTPPGVVTLSVAVCVAVSVHHLQE